MAAYVNRATYLLSRGRPAAQIALYYPTSSMWLGADESNTSVLAIARQLLEGQRDFDFVDEQALSSLQDFDFVDEQALSSPLRHVRNGLKNLSGQVYRAVIIPSVAAISRAALNRLRAFSAAGGRVLLLGRPPALVVERSFLKAAGPADMGWAIQEPSGELTSRIIASLPAPDVVLDPPCPAVKYLHRSWRDADLYFFFNSSSEKLSFRAALAGRGRVQRWDAASGRIETVKDAIVEKGVVHIPLLLESYKTHFIVIAH